MRRTEHTAFAFDVVEHVLGRVRNVLTEHADAFVGGHAGSCSPRSIEAT